MFLVVFVHVQDYVMQTTASDASPGLESACMVLAVVTFFTVSGFFSRDMISSRSLLRLASRIVLYLWPVLTLVGGVGITVRVLCGAPAVPPCGLPSFLMSVGWFFFCLTLCEGVTFAAHFLFPSRIPLRVAFLTLSYVGLWALPFGMFHAVEMLPFFWFGVYALPRLEANVRLRAVVWLLSLAAFALVCVAVGDLRQAGLNFHCDSMGLLHFEWKGLARMAGRISLGMAGACAFSLTVRVLVLRFRFLTGLACFGRETLGIFFVHVVLLFLYFSVACRCGGLLGQFALALTVFAASYGLTAAVRRNRVANAVLFDPLSFYKWRCKKEVPHEP